MSADRNVEIVRRWFEGGVWGNPDAEAAEAYIDAHYAKDGRAYGLSGSYVTGPPAFKQFRAAMVARFPDIAMEVNHILAEGDEVAVRFTATMTHGEKTVEFQACAFVEMKDGQITRAWNTVNFLEWFEQIGLVPEGSLPTFLETGALGG